MAAAHGTRSRRFSSSGSYTSDIEILDKLKQRTRKLSPIIHEGVLPAPADGRAKKAPTQVLSSSCCKRKSSGEIVQALLEDPKRKLTLKSVSQARSGVGQMRKKRKENLNNSRMDQKPCDPGTCWLPGMVAYICSKTLVGPAMPVVPVSMAANEDVPEGMLMVCP